MTLQRLSALHYLLLGHGARMIDESGWQRPWAFGDSPEREVDQVRRHVGLLDLSPQSKFAIKGAAANIDRMLGQLWPGDSTPPLRARRMAPDGVTVCRLTVDEVLVLTPPAARTSTLILLEDAVAGRTDTCLHVLDVASGHAGLRLVGPSARDVVRLCTSLDVRENAFANLTLGKTAFARVQALVLRDDLGGLPAFSIFFSRDFAQHVWEWLVEVGGPYHLAPFGLAALHLLETVHA